MATLRQIEANRLNAQKSTGPRTPEGRAVSSQNALKSGLDAESQFVAGEDRADFAQLQHEYIGRFQPLTPEERFQVDSLLRNEWILRRLFRAEAQLWEYYTLRADRSEGVPLGEALVAGHEAFRRLQRRITVSERSYKDAFAELERLQRARPPVATAHTAPEPGNLEPDHTAPPSQPPTSHREELGSFLHSPGAHRSSKPTGVISPLAISWLHAFLQEPLVRRGHPHGRHHHHPGGRPEPNSAHPAPERRQTEFLRHLAKPLHGLLEY